MHAVLCLISGYDMYMPALGGDLLRNRTLRMSGKKHLIKYLYLVRIDVNNIWLEIE